MHPSFLLHGGKNLVGGNVLHPFSNEKKKINFYLLIDNITLYESIITRVVTRRSAANSLFKGRSASPKISAKKK